MSRYSAGRSYNHRCTADEYRGDYLISWVVDYYYPSSRLRYPRGFRRWTDRKGAERFCKKWGINMPEPK